MCGTREGVTRIHMQGNTGLHWFACNYAKGVEQRLGIQWTCIHVLMNVHILISHSFEKRILFIVDYIKQSPVCRVKCKLVTKTVISLFVHDIVNTSCVHLSAICIVWNVQEIGHRMCAQVDYRMCTNVGHERSKKKGFTYMIMLEFWNRSRSRNVHRCSSCFVNKKGKECGHI